MSSAHQDVAYMYLLLMGYIVALLLLIYGCDGTLPPFMGGIGALVLVGYGVGFILSCAGVSIYGEPEPPALYQRVHTSPQEADLEPMETLEVLVEEEDVEP